MADFSSLSLVVKYGEVSDYSDGVLSRSFTKTSTTPTKVQQYLVSAALVGDGGTTLDLSSFATVQALVLKNKDATNFVTATYRSSAGAATDQKQKLLAGQYVVLTDITIASDLLLVADTAALDCEVLVIGT